MHHDPHRDTDTAGETLSSVILRVIILKNPADKFSLISCVQSYSTQVGPSALAVLIICIQVSFVEEYGVIVIASVC